MSFSRSKGVFWLLGVLMVIAPLFRSGKTPSALLALELLSLVILLLLWWTPGANRKLSWGQVAAVVGLMVLPLVYLVPLPAGVVHFLPGREDYVLARVLAGDMQALNWQGLSLYPRETFSGWLVLLIPLATFLAARSLETRQLRSLVTLLFVIVGFQAVLGLVQYGTGAGSPFYLGMEGAYGSAVGTYPNRNHFAGLLYMVLMIALALFMATFGRHRARVGYQTLRQRIVYFSSMRGHQAFLFAAFSLLILLAIVFSRSRAGIGLMMLGIILASILFAQRIGGKNAMSLTRPIVAVALGFAISIGLAPVLDRFSVGSTASDGRWVMFEDTMKGIQQFFSVGSGPSTFRETFPAFQDPSQGGYIINNAHNDYLEWVYDGGILAGLLIAGFLLLYFIRWAGVWKKEAWGEFRFIQVGAGIGMLLMLLHELMDYNLMRPANMVVFAFFAALFFHEYDEATDPRSGVQDKKRGEAGPGVRVPSQRMRPVVAPVFDENEKNPFMD